MRVDFDSIQTMLQFLILLSGSVGALIYLVNVIIIKPRQALKKEREEEILHKLQPINDNITKMASLSDAMQQSLENHSDMLDRLADISNEQKEMLANHDRQLRAHDQRLWVLEYNSGILTVNRKKEKEEE